ncbi:MAG: VTC domain-containing protein [Anaerolineales bacterium]|nr:VTC domain-containing protein [Anaerolineales bacterium]
MATGGNPAADAQGYTHLRSRRYERKLLTEELLPRQVEALVRLHPLMFHDPYPPRQINSLYLDTADMQNYYDNVSGAETRRKVRLRWYGALTGPIARPMLEIKVKDGLVGRKISYAMAPFMLDGDFCGRAFQEAAGRSDLPPVVRTDLRTLSPVLLNCYQRSYHATRDGRFRITVDWRQDFYKINAALSNSLLHRQRNACDVIVEIKYEIEQEPRADRVAGYFPFRVSRNSKYVQGIERVYF